MPRNLNDLFEAAVSTAPPERHHAADITHLAQRAQRRRTTFVAATVSLAVAVVAGVTVGITQHHPSTPEPAGNYRYGQHQDLADALASSSASNFKMLDYGVPSVADLGGDLAPVGQYVDVDARGRLAVMQLKLAGGNAQSPNLAATYQLVDGAGGRVHDLPAPPTSAAAGELGAGPWQLTFSPDERLLWKAGGGGTGIDYRTTSLDGNNPVRITRTLDDLPGNPTNGHQVRDVWFEGGRVWFSAVTRDDLSNLDDQREWVSLFSFDPAHPEVLRAEKPHDALTIDMAGTEAVWLDGDTVRAVDLTTGQERTVPVPVDPGCHAPAASSFVGGAFPGTLSTNGDLVSLVEMCQGPWHLVVTDLTGRLVTDVVTGSPSQVVTQVRFAGDLIVFQSTHDQYVDDLTTGELLRLGAHSPKQTLGYPRPAGRYVLWYDTTGGHVGEIR